MATSTARAVPPDPSTTARTPARWLTPSSASAPVTPSTSVQSACQPVPERTRVLAAPTALARSVQVSAAASATSLSGIVTDSPTHSGPKPFSSPGKPASSHSSRS